MLQLLRVQLDPTHLTATLNWNPALDDANDADGGRKEREKERETERDKFPDIKGRDLVAIEGSNK